MDVKPLPGTLNQRVRLPEDELLQLMERCTVDAALKCGSGFVIGALAALVVPFMGRRRRVWPALFGAGYGLGMAYKSCERQMQGLIRNVE